MRPLLLILLTAAAMQAQTVTIDARHWGPDSVAKTAADAAHFMAFLDGNNITTDGIYWLAQYEYTLTDSAISVYDLNQPDPKPLLRFFNPTAPEPTECAVSPIWCTITRHSPANKRYAKFSGWKGGPEPTQVGPLLDGDKAALTAKIARVKAQVDAMKKDGKDWKDKAGKTLTAKGKRSAAWKIATGKAKASDYTKVNKGKAK